MKRKKIWIKVYPDDYLWGTTKAELKPDERAVWFDFLCVAAYKQGLVDITYPKSLASKILVPLPLLVRCIRKFEKQGKIDNRWRKQYCEGDFSRCKRYQMTEKGTSHPDNMMPDGSIIEGLK